MGGVGRRYGQGWVGLWTAAFIYSKLFELFDTLWLLAKKRPVIFLHWYHHLTVLLYCWHSYAARLSSGLWFARCHAPTRIAHSARRGHLIHISEYLT